MLPSSGSDAGASFPRTEVPLDRSCFLPRQLLPFLSSPENDHSQYVCPNDLRHAIFPSSIIRSLRSLGACSRSNLASPDVYQAALNDSLKRYLLRWEHPWTRRIRRRCRVRIPKSSPLQHTTSDVAPKKPRSKRPRTYLPRIASRNRAVHAKKGADSKLIRRPRFLLPSTRHRPRRPFHRTLIRCLETRQLAVGEMPPASQRSCPSLRSWMP